MQFQAQLCSVGFNALRFVLQQAHAFRVEFGCVYQPQVQVAVTRVGNGAGAAHEIQAVDGVAGF